jgi:polysaccharide export outer membrane protein
MRNKDVIYISNATTVQITKALQYFRQVVASVNDPIVAAQNGLILNNLIKTAR